MSMYEYEELTMQLNQLAKDAVTMAFTSEELIEEIKYLAKSIQNRSNQLDEEMYAEYKRSMVLVTP